MGREKNTKVAKRGKYQNGNQSFLKFGHRQLTLPRAVCLAGSAGVAPEDVARVATTHQALLAIFIIMLLQ